MSVQRCAECTCEHGGDDCNWIMSAADRAAARQRKRIAMRDELAAALAEFANDGCAEKRSCANFADRLMNEGWIKGGGE